MNIRIVSDLHLEFLKRSTMNLAEIFETMVPYLPGEQDMILVLAGDIVAGLDQWNGNAAKDFYTPWIKELVSRHRAVIYVGGNHEGYGASIASVQNYWHELAEILPLFHFLENETVVFDDVRFLGTTLWTNIENPMDEMAVKKTMNDFVVIPNWGTAGYKYAHKLAVNFLTTELSRDWAWKTVVVTHHLPTYSSINAKYKMASNNAGYASNLDNLIAYNDIDIWFHGHTHDSVDYTVADTRIVCNPFGYLPDLLNPEFDGKKVLTL